MEERNDIVITSYKKEYYADLVDSGYYSLTPFHTYLAPDFYYKVRNLLNIDEIKKFVNRHFFLNNKQITRVAYSKQDQKAVGSITSRKITERLWGIWSFFVSPEYRGRRIGITLGRENFRLLKEMNVERTIAMIAKTNVPSLKAHKSTGLQLSDYGYLRSRIFRCERIGPIPEPDFEKTKVRKLHQGEKKQLFEIFELCVGKQWRSYLEIDQENYLDRIYGPGFWEECGLLSRLAMKKNILVAESGGKLQGYAISHAIRFFDYYYALHLFVPVSKGFDAVCRALLIKSFRPPNFKRNNRFSFIYIGDEKCQKHLVKLGFETQEFLAPYDLL